jgi:hypothetical protein
MPRSGMMGIEATRLVGGSIFFSVDFPQRYPELIFGD